jgi:hypothetical protein
MTYSWWDALKDFLGVLGSAMMVIPWLRDFYLRQKKVAVSEVRTSGKLSQLRDTIVGSIRDKIDKPKMADFVWTVLGLACICLSFLIALVRGVMS